MITGRAGSFAEDKLITCCNPDSIVGIVGRDERGFVVGSVPLKDGQAESGNQHQTRLICTYAYLVQRIERQDGSKFERKVCCCTDAHPPKPRRRSKRHSSSRATSVPVNITSLHPTL